MYYFITTYGCQMNKSDSERIASFLESIGYKATKKESEADLIVVNVCSIRQSATNRIYGLIPKFNKLKIKNKKLKIVLTGCVLNKDKGKLSKGFDLILNIKNLTSWSKKLKITKAPNFKLGSYFQITPKRKTSFSTFIPISNGCNNFCAYCVVPYVRGPEICRDHKEIITEVKNVLKNGVKEIWLLGQNVNSYKSPTNKSVNFAELLRMVNQIPGNFWIRFTSPHPKDFSSELIKTMADYEKVTEYLNLPVQAGDNEILKKMNRPYTVERYKKLVKEIKKAIPNISLSTDIIVGFPGETKRQFENTVKLFKQIKFDMAYIAKYSPRPGTVAIKLGDDISRKEKERRWKVLNKTLKKTALEKNKQYIKETVDVLVDGIKQEHCFGKTRTYKNVKFLGDKNLIGKFVRVKITNALPWGLKGNLVQEPSLIVILGPTASGKSELAVKLAKKLNGEIISADSRQVYKGMNIGTGKITKKDMQGIPHHLLSIISPKKTFTVVEYRKLALKAIDKTIKKGKTPILCGGTGFYIQAIVDGIMIPRVKPDWELRKKLEKKTIEELLKKLKKLDPKRAKTIETKNKRRLIRALEIILKTKKPVPSLQKQPLPYPVLIIGVKKENLEKLIRKRFFEWLKKGFLKEVKRLKKTGLSWKKIEELGIHYRAVAQYLRGNITYEQMIENSLKELNKYAKRQMTWFKRDKRIKWIKNYREAEKLIK